MRGGRREEGGRDGGREGGRERGREGGREYLGTEFLSYAECEGRLAGAGGTGEEEGTTRHFFGPGRGREGRKEVR